MRTDVSPESSPVVRVPVEVLETMVGTIFKKYGCSEQEAKTISAGLVDADVSGHPSHGVIRTTRYLKWLKDKKLIANQTPLVEDSGGPIIRIDGRRGFGQIMGAYSVNAGCQRAKQNGIALVALGQSGHLGRIGKWAEDAAANKVCSIHFVCVRGHPLVAPFGGSERMMSTAPIAIGVPSNGDKFIVHDFSTASISEGKVLLCAKSGRSLPQKYLIQSDGEATDDPYSLYGPKKGSGPLMPAEGAAAISPFGEHKGSGLAMMGELLAGVLTSSGVTDHETVRGDVWSGMLSIYIDGAKLNGNLAEEVHAYVERMRKSAPRDQTNPIKAPGDYETETREVSKVSGLELPAEVWTELENELSAQECRSGPRATVPS